jgi:hypothetical protein
MDSCNGTGETPCKVNHLPFCIAGAGRQQNGNLEVCVDRLVNTGAFFEGSVDQTSFLICKNIPNV